jgi:hypothetical protein
LSFSNVNTGLGSFIKDSNSSRQRDDIGAEDLSLLKSNSSVTYTYKSRNYHAIPAGEYKVRVRFSGIVYTAEDFQLNQRNGRIWVGDVYAYKVAVIHPNP